MILNKESTLDESNDKIDGKGIICEVTFQNKIVAIIYKQPGTLSNWNTIREKLFKHIEEKLLKKIVDRGLKKPHHKDLIKNNYSDFSRFFERKIRYLISHYIKLGKFDVIFSDYNSKLEKEIELNLKESIQSENKHEMETKISDVNKQIDFIQQNDLVDMLQESLLKDRDFLDNILNYTSEFNYYLVMF